MSNIEAIVSAVRGSAWVLDGVSGRLSMRDDLTIEHWAADGDICVTLSDECDEYQAIIAAAMAGQFSAE